MSAAADKNKLESLLTIGDLMEITKIPKSTLQVYVASGEIPSLKIGRLRRFSPAAIKKWLNKKEV